MPEKGFALFVRSLFLLLWVRFDPEWRVPRRERCDRARPADDEARDTTAQRSKKPSEQRLAKADSGTAS